MDPLVFEKLGQFYLGRPYDLGSGTVTEGVTLYDARDLTTHAVCVGMTGSGKTGLCVSLLEEAAIDGIPALVIDPKGDLTNLLLTFPDLAPADFQPWVDPDEAARQGLSVPEFAESQAELWRKGLGEWGQDGERIKRLREAVDFTVYTPGSSAGLGVSILGSFAAPSAAVLEDGELFGDRIESTVTGLLALLGIDADPLQSREHILVSTVVREAWRRGLDLDLEGLIHRIQRPTVDRVGVMDLESFFPAKERFTLAMSLNNLLAAPGFDSWLSGDPLDVGSFLHTPGGKPRVSVFSIAHLSDAERMFFMSLLLNETVGWMRGQSGTSSLRAILYIDEIFGFMPPVAEPPSKKPLLTLLKQGRAFGVGVVLATQNPVDLDYKGLSNAGTWFVGRLQTERDKARLMEGLEGAAKEGGGSFDAAAMGEVLAGLGKRVFLLHDVHEDAPRIFHTRWALSYLRGPMTRDQIRRLSSEWNETPASTPAVPAETTLAAEPGLTPPGSSRPLLPPGVPEAFVRSRSDVDGDAVRYVPAIRGVARVSYSDARRNVDHAESVTLLSALRPDTTDVRWDEARPFGIDEDRLGPEALEGAAYAPIPALATDEKRYPVWRRELRDYLYRNRSLVLFRSEAVGEVSKPGEAEGAFRVRLTELLRERRDEAVDELRQRFAARIARAEASIRRAEQALDTQEDQARAASMDMALNVGESLLAAFVGGRRRRGLTRGRRAARGMTRRAKESRDVDRARETLTSREMGLRELEEQLRDEVDALEARFDPAGENLRTLKIKPRQRDVDVRCVTLAWVPVRR